MESRGSTGSYRPWYEHWPDLLDWERERFGAWELPWVVDEEAKAHGFLVVHSEVEFRGNTVPIRVEYPSETPELPPTVFSDPPILDRHQQPFRGNFCLLARPEDDWNARDWGAADLIGHQLKALLRDSEAGVDVVRENEAPIPEPPSATFAYEEDSVVLIPGNLACPEGDEGRFPFSSSTRAASSSRNSTGSTETGGWSAAFRRRASDVGAGGASTQHRREGRPAARCSPGSGRPIQISSASRLPLPRSVGAGKARAGEAVTRRRKWSVWSSQRRPSRTGLNDTAGSSYWPRSQGRPCSSTHRSFPKKSVLGGHPS